MCVCVLYFDIEFEWWCGEVRWSVKVRWSESLSGIKVKRRRTHCTGGGGKCFCDGGVSGNTEIEIVKYFWKSLKWNTFAVLKIFKMYILFLMLNIKIMFIVKRNKDRAIFIILLCSNMIFPKNWRYFHSSTPRSSGKKVLN